jgi:hypothetical protein
VYGKGYPRQLGAGASRMRLSSYGVQRDPHDGGSSDSTVRLFRLTSARD